MIRNNLKNDNSEKEQSEKGRFLKMTHLKNDNSEKATFDKTKNG